MRSRVFIVIPFLLLLLNPCDMLVEAPVRFLDEPAVEVLFAASRFIAAAEDNRAPDGVEREGKAPDAVIGGKPVRSHRVRLRTMSLLTRMTYNHKVLEFHFSRVPAKPSTHPELALLITGL